MKSKLLLSFTALALIASAAVTVRSRAQIFRGTDEWHEVELQYPLQLKHTAIILCDLWDKHWCRGANERVNLLVAKIEPLLLEARKKGVLVIHSPSDTMDFYNGKPQRTAILEMPKASPTAVRHIDDPKLPIDDSDGGCDTPGDKTYKAWTREHPGITIAPSDLISDKGDEVYSALKVRGITDLLVMGVHTNMCILNRSFAIKQMSKLGVRCLLVRDLTDAMYDPHDPPFVSHQRGTELVVEHIEKYWCPSILSTDFLNYLRQKH